MIAIVDDDSLIRRWLGRVLEKGGHSVLAFATGAELLERLSPEVGVVCLDLGLEGLQGMEILHLLQEKAPDLSVIVITAENRPETIVEAMKAGAYDYLVKPLDPERVLQSVNRAAEREHLLKEVHRLKGEALPLVSLVGDSPPMQEIRRQIERLSESDVTVCLQGETGTGKEVAARLLHETSRRHKGPFVAFNCAAVPEALEEAELFGHERGAFSGAGGVRKGRFEQANGGTLFLDEVGDMAPSTQAALLRTLQQRTVTRLGASVEIPVDVRIVSATHRDLLVEVAEGRFRQDLYYRLVVYPILLPPLRERLSDLPLLVAHFLKKLGKNRPPCRFHPDALSLLTRHDWPGNIRELENVLHRAILACDGGEIAPHHLPIELRSERPKSDANRRTHPPSEPKINAKKRLKEAEREAIQRALADANGHVGQAAELLGISRATLYRRLSSMD